MGSSGAPFLGCRGQKMADMSTVTNLVTGNFGLSDRFCTQCRQPDAYLFYICLLSSYFMPPPSPKFLDFAVTNLVTVLIFAIFWPGHMINPLIST